MPTQTRFELCRKNDNKNNPLFYNSNGNPFSFTFMVVIAGNDTRLTTKYRKFVLLQGKKHLKNTRKQ